MSFQTCKTFVHLRNTNEDIFDEFRELSDPPIDSKDPYTIKVQKRSKDIVKIIHVASVVRIQCLYADALFTLFMLWSEHKQHIRVHTLFTYVILSKRAL